MSLPFFKYHPNPIATGQVDESDTMCVCCRQARGWIYIGPVYAVGEFDEQICPWCIADGTANRRLSANFNDDTGIGGGGLWDEVPVSVMEEITYRTPGFIGWQQEQWWTHCNDGGAFLGRVGHEELEDLGPEAIEAIRESTGLDEGPDWQRFYKSLDQEDSPSAYLFRCLHCDKFGGYTDSD